MNEKTEAAKEKSRVRVYNTRYQKRQEHFAGNRPDDQIGSLDRTPKPRKQKGGPKKRKDLTVEPLSDRPLYTMPDKESVPVSGAGEVNFNVHGIMSDGTLTSSTATTNGTSTHTTDSRTRQTSSVYQRNPITVPAGNPSWRQPPGYNYFDPLGINSTSSSSRPRDPWKDLDIPSVTRPAVTFESVKGMIGEAQERSMKTMMEKFEQMLSSHLSVQTAPSGIPDRGNSNNNKNRKKRGNNRNRYNDQGAKGYPNNEYNEPRFRDQHEPELRGFEDPNENYSQRNRTNGLFESPSQGRGSAREGSWSSGGNQIKVQLDRWNVKFDGSNVEELWFKIDCCKEASPYTWDQVFKHFHCLLSDRLQRWYWRFRENNRGAGIQLLRSTMLDTFRTRETDMDIWGLMMKRKQRAGERFDEFWKEMEELSWRFKLSRSSDEIIQVLRANMLPEISLALTVYETTSLSKFLDKCREADKNLRYQTYAQGKFTRRVNELDLDSTNEPAIEALRFPYKRPEEKSFQRREGLTCANCDSVEHLWRDCPIEKRRIFCFKCCLQGVTTPKCPNCNPSLAENSKNSD